MVPENNLTNISVAKSAIQTALWVVAGTLLITMIKVYSSTDPQAPLGYIFGPLFAIGMGVLALVISYVVLKIIQKLNYSAQSTSLLRILLICLALLFVYFFDF